MNPNNTYLAVFLGSKTSPQRKAWDALSEVDRRVKEREGMAAWKAWVEKHHAAIVSIGGPLGKTKKVTQRGIDDVSNDMGAFTVVRADSHEAAAKLFDKHPHFSISRAILSRSCPCCPFQALRGGGAHGFRPGRSESVVRRGTANHWHSLLIET